MTAPQTFAPVALPPLPPPPPDLFDLLGDCLQLPSPVQQAEWAREIFSEAHLQSIANGPDRRLFGLACELAVRSFEGPELADVAGQLLTRQACFAMAGSEDEASRQWHGPVDGGNLGWALLAAHGLSSVEAETEAVQRLLSTQKACENMAHRTFAHIDHDVEALPLAATGELLDRYLTPSICGAIARSNSHAAIGDAAEAIIYLPMEQRAATASTLLSPGACTAVGMSGDVRALTQALGAAMFLPPEGRNAVVDQLLMPRARAAVARSERPHAIVLAARAMGLMPPSPWRDEALREVLTVAASDLVADHGWGYDIAGAACAATLLPPGPEKDEVLASLLPIRACAEVRNTDEGRWIAEAAYAATFLPPGPAREAALSLLITEDTCRWIIDLRDAPSLARAAFAAAHLKDGDARTRCLEILVTPAHMDIVVAGGEAENQRLMEYAAEARRLLEPNEGEAVRATLGRRLHERDWRNVMAELQERNPPGPRRPDRTPGDAVAVVLPDPPPATPGGGASGPSL